MPFGVHRPVREAHNGERDLRPHGSTKEKCLALEEGAVASNRRTSTKAEEIHQAGKRGKGVHSKTGTEVMQS